MVSQNDAVIIQSFNNLAKKIYLKSIGTYDFVALYTKLDYIIIRLSSDGTAYLGKKQKRDMVLIKNHFNHY